MATDPGSWMSGRVSVDIVYRIIVISDAGTGVARLKDEVDVAARGLSIKPSYS